MNEQRVDIGLPVPCRTVGGSDFITKPFLAQEITLKALTLALRRRLQAHTATRAAARQEQSAFAL